MNNEIIVINKEKGLTSRDVVNKLCKILHTKRIGHTGTLDPMAEGVLVCLTNKYTKLVNIITSLEKEYIAEIKLGIKTDTLDITGNVNDTTDIPKLNINDINNVLNSMIGLYLEEVPIYSAVKVNGKRLYEYARNNENVILPKREVNIKNIELISYNNDIIKFKCLVSKGTYIRSLISTICNKLNVIGTMNSLVRTKQGNFYIEDSYKLNDIENSNYKSIDIHKVLDIKDIYVDDNLYKKVINGNKLNMNCNGYVMFIKDNKYIALYNFKDSMGESLVLF